MKKVLGCLSIAALAAVLAAPVSAQTLKLKASVPFDFVVGGRTMPAGDYVVRTANDSGVLAVENVSAGGNFTFIMSIAADGPLDRGEAFLTFHRYGGDYYLAQIWDGSVAEGRAIPTSSAERERSQSATLRKPEVVMVLARR